MTRTTLSLMAGALSLAVVANPAGRIDPTPIEGQRALLNSVGRPAEMVTSVGGGRLVTGDQALLNGTFAGDPADAPVSVGVADRTRVQFSGVQALLSRQ